MRHPFLALGFAVLLASCSAGEPIPENQASIPFLSRATVRDWEAPDDKTVYIQRMNGDWYRADLLGPCMGLAYATVLGFVNERGTPQFNRFGEILVGRERCKVVSLVQSPAPPSIAADGRKARTIAEDGRSS